MKSDIIFRGKKLPASIGGVNTLSGEGEVSDDEDESREGLREAYIFIIQLIIA